MMKDAPLRPWSSTGLRLGIKVGKHGPPGETSLGWALLRLGPRPVTSGETAVDDAVVAVRPLGAAEYRTLREDCGLSVREAAEWHQINERTLGYWESPDREGPRAGAAADLIYLRAQLARAADTALALVKSQIAAHPDLSGQSVDLARYTAHDYPFTQPAAEGLPHGAHNRLLALTAEALAKADIDVEISYRGTGRFEPSKIAD